MNKADQKIITVTLKKPIPYGDGTLDKLDLRTPTAGDLRGVNLGDLYQLNTDTVLKVMPRIAQENITSEQLNALSMPDLLTITQELTNFFELGNGAA